MNFEPERRNAKVVHEVKVNFVEMSQVIFSISGNEGENMTKNEKYISQHANHVGDGLHLEADC